MSSLKEVSQMRLHVMTVSAAAILLLSASNAHSQGHGSFSFHAESIGGPTGEVSMTGGGSYDSATGFLSGGGGFRCLADINSGPLSGCKAGEGVRWHVSQLLRSTGFKCSGDPGEVLKTAVTDNDTVVMMVDFYRQGDGASPSFTAKVFVSAEDEASDLTGVQNVWVQAVGCGDARTNVK
jgi:hypothetical protein